MQIQVGIVTISDRASAGDYEDLGGPALREAAQRQDGKSCRKRLFPMMRNGFGRRFIRFHSKGAA